MEAQRDLITSYKDRIWTQAAISTAYALTCWVYVSYDILLSVLLSDIETYLTVFKCNLPMTKFASGFFLLKSVVDTQIDKYSNF